MKKAIVAQLKAHPGTVYINSEVEEKETSAGQREWRTDNSLMGPAWGAASPVHPMSFRVDCMYSIPVRETYS